MRFKVDWAGLIVGRKFNIFALFSFEFESNFPSTIPRGGLILREGFLRYDFGGLIFGGAYFRRLSNMAKDQFNQHCVEQSLTSPENVADEN